MQYHQIWRKKYPETDFETRSLPIINGVRHFITMERWYWQKLDVLIDVGFYKSLDEITQVCAKHALHNNQEYNQDLGHAFAETLMYFVYGNYQTYRRAQLGIANNFWREHF